MARPNNVFEIIAAYDKLIFETNSNIKALKAYPTILNNENDKKHHLIFDRCLYLSLIQSDLLTSLKYLDISNFVGNAFEANYFARATALHCYETLNHLGRSIGKEVQQAFSDSSYESLLKNVNSTGKKLNSLKGRLFFKLQLLRNNVFAHKSASGLEQTAVLLGINNKEMYDFGESILKANFELIEAYMRFLEIK